MARSSAKDPLDKFRWSIDIDGFDRMGFTNVETPSYKVNTKEYREGGDHLHPKVIIDSIEYTPIILLRGVTSEEAFINWARSSLNIVDASENSKEQKKYDTYRKNIIIHHHDRAGRIIRSYFVHNAIPIEYKPASDFAADGDDGISLEKLVLAYESFTVVRSGDTGSGKLSILDTIKKLTRNY